MAPTDTGWSYGTSGDLSVPEDILPAAAKIPATAYAAVDRILQEMVAGGLTQNDKLSTLPSGTLLGDEFSSAGIVAYGIVKSVRDMFNNFGDALMWAEKKYKSTDQTTADSISKAGQSYSSIADANNAFISEYRDLATKAAGAPITSQYTAPTDQELAGYQQNNYRISANSELVAPMPVGGSGGEDSAPLPGFLQSIKQQLQHGNQHPTIEMGSGQWESQIKDFADHWLQDNVNESKVGVWKKAGSDLQNAAENFFSGMQTVCQNWKGQGSGAALSAANSLRSGIVGGDGNGGLAGQLTAVGNALGTAVKSITGTANQVHSDLYNGHQAYYPEKKYIEQTLTDYDRDDAGDIGMMPELISFMEQARQKAITDFDKGYPPAVATASTSIPTLQAPTSPLTPVNPNPPPPPPSSPPPSPSDKNTPGDSATRPGSSAGSPGAGSPTPSATSSQKQQATDKAAQEARAQQEQKASRQEAKFEQQQRQSQEQEKQKEQQEQQQEKQKEQQEQQQEKQKEQQEQQQEKQKEQQEQQQEQQQAAQQAMQQAMQTAQQIVQQGLQMAQQGTQQASLASLSSIPGLSTMTEPANAHFGSEKGDGGAGSLGGRLAGGPESTPESLRSDLQASKLFPRATTTEAQAATAGSVQAGIAPTQGGMGTTGGMGAGGMGAAGAGQNKERKRAEFLDSAEHLDEALGDAPIVAKPVVEN